MESYMFTSRLRYIQNTNRALHANAALRTSISDAELIEEFLSFFDRHDDEYGTLEDAKVHLSKQQFDTLMSKSKCDTDTDTCAICLDNVEIDKYLQLPCSHVFHIQCIKRWLCTESTKCPLCNRDMRVDC